MVVMVKALQLKATSSTNKKMATGALVKYEMTVKTKVQIVVKSNIAHKIIKELNLIFKSFCLKLRIMAMLLTIPINTKTKQIPSKVNCNGLRGFFSSISNRNSFLILITELGNLQRMIWTLPSLINEKQSNQNLSNFILNQTDNLISNESADSIRLKMGLSVWLLSYLAFLMPWYSRSCMHTHPLSLCSILCNKDLNRKMHFNFKRL